MGRIVFYSPPLYLFNMKKFEFKCIKCGQIGKTDQFCQCNQNPYYNYLTPIYDYQKIKQQNLINFDHHLKEPGLDKYLSLLPNSEFKITLGEGNTPLLKLNNFGKKLGLSHLYVKNETTNPTGCFKDRETSVVANLALDLGKKNVAIASSGNAAISAAAYSNLAGLKCTCYIPKTASIGKKRLLSIFGVSFQEVNGAYAMIYRFLVDKLQADSDIWNITPGQNIFKEEGDKTIAFEIFEQAGVPDKIIVPVGNGSLLYGAFKGFWELKQLGLIDKLPQFIGVEIKGYAPVAEAIRQNKDYIHLEAEPVSIAEGGIAAQEAFCCPKAILALKETNGIIVEITDDDLIRTLKNLLKLESFMAEPTSLAPFAALSKIEIKPDEKVVCVATGNAFKNLQEIFDILAGDTRN